MIRFKSKHSASVTMFDQDAKHMLEIMNLSGTIPSALRAEDIGNALNSLETAVKQEGQEESGENLVMADEPIEVSTEEEWEEEKENVSIQARAYPLIELLKDAQKKQESVQWDYDSSVL